MEVLTIGYITFIKLSQIKKKKTDDIKLFNKDTEACLGEIKWFPAFRKYSYFPAAGIVLDAKCLDVISKYLNDLNLKYKKDNLKGSDVKEN
ncbi:MAG: hypothetical protein M0Q88_01000 [Bacilli bacterium]|nr:hypothetical protein [Bacilli bacterium]